jgi:NhaA family Na+:H+ antiporter
MTIDTQTLSLSFQRFFNSEKASGIILILCTIASLAITNFLDGTAYVSWWHTPLAGLSLEHWINDGVGALQIRKVVDGTIRP